MNCFGDELFAGAAFSADEHRGARRRDLGDQVKKRKHFFAFADDVGEIEALFKRALELDVFFAEMAGFDGLRHLREEFVVGPRLGDVVERATLERGASHFNGTVGGDEDDREARITLANFAQQFEAIAIGQADVEQHQVERMFSEFGEAGFAGLRAGNAVAFAGEQKLEAFANFRLVVNYQDRTFRHVPTS